MSCAATDYDTHTIKYGSTWQQIQEAEEYVPLSAPQPALISSCYVTCGSLWFTFAYLFVRFYLKFQEIKVVSDDF